MSASVRVASAVWEHDPDTRTLCFIVPGTDPRTGPVRIKAVPQESLSYERMARDGQSVSERVARERLAHAGGFTSGDGEEEQVHQNP